MTRERDAEAGAFLVLGTGSVGRRHAKNLRALGADVACFDPRADRLEQARQEIASDLEVFQSLDEALAEPERFAGVVVASPPSFHVEQTTRAIQIGLPTLLEKPVAPDLASALRLNQAAQAADVPVLLGYTYRWWPPFVELRRRIRDGAVGELRHARFVMSAHLADWHPWERYQDFFMASRELGGGALLDESHFIDLMLWFFGMPQSLFGRVEHLSQLEITTDDNVDLVVIYPHDFRVTIHLDLYGRPHEKSVTVTGEAGTLQSAFDPNVVRWSNAAGGEWQTQMFECERNDMFLAAAREFVEVARGVRSGLTCTVQDGVDVLRCVEAVRTSQAENRLVALSELC